ncbi:MAG TPA: hypothetical protein DCS93_08515 [Microscillaceae bacterium]|nr:hypothetical protein [Microscillaceae bacterium]
MVSNAAIFDFETNPQITGVAELANGEVSKQVNFTINVNNVVEIAASDFTMSIDENLANGTTIGTITLDNPQGDVNFSIASQTPQGVLAINSASGTLTVADMSLLDFETNPKLTGVITIVNGGETSQINFTINLNNVTEITASDFTGSIDENSANGTAIGTVTASTDQGNLAYSIVSQTLAGAVAINSATGALTVADAAIFDFETNTKVTGKIKVASSDVSKEVNFTVNINNVTEITASDFTASIDENSANGTAIGTITASTDQGNLSFSIASQNPTGAVAINSSTGALTVADAAIFDFETNTKVTGKVKVASGNVSKEVNFTVNINDLTESPAASKYSSVKLTAPLGDGSSKNFIDLKLGTTYSTNDALAATATATKIDVGYYYGAIDNASLASPGVYPATFLDLSGWGLRNNATIFKSTLTTAQFDALTTNDDLTTAFNAQTSPGVSRSITGLNQGDVLAFRTDPNKAGGGQIGFIKVSMIEGTFNFGDGITLDIIVIK